MVRDGIPVRVKGRHRYSVIDGLSGSCMAQIVRLEQTRFRPGETAAAFRDWWALAHRSRQWYAPLSFADCSYCEAPECCEPTAFPRDQLEDTLRALPRRPARELRVLVRELDARILARSPLLLAEPSDAYWWVA